MKRVFMIMLMMFPILLKAEVCDYKSYDEDIKLAQGVEYETTYYSLSQTIGIDFYNVYGNLYLTYDKKNYYSDENGKVSIKGITEGKSIKIYVNSGLKNCTSFIKSINIEGIYYNQFYDSEKCLEYKGKLSACSEQFLNYKIDEELMNKMINNYNKSFNNETDSTKVTDNDKNNNSNETIINKIEDIINEWGVLIIIVIIVSLITNVIFRNIFRKIKHGI